MIPDPRFNVWKEGQTRQGGECPIGYPYRVDPKVLQREIKLRPRALAIDNSWWPDYYDEFGDDALFVHTGWLNYRSPREEEFYLQHFGAVPPKPEAVTLSVVLIIKMRDSVVLSRADWLSEHRCYYGWVYPAQMNLYRQYANIPEHWDTRYIN